MVVVLPHSLFFLAHCNGLFSAPGPYGDEPGRLQHNSLSWLMLPRFQSRPTRGAHWLVLNRIASYPSRGAHWLVLSRIASHPSRRAHWLVLNQTASRPSRRAHWLVLNPRHAPDLELSDVAAGNYAPSFAPAPRGAGTGPGSPWRWARRPGAFPSPPGDGSRSSSLTASRIAASPPRTGTPRNAWVTASSPC